MRVAELLRTKGDEVVTIDQHRSVEDAVALLRTRGIGALIVTGGGVPIAGVLSERDVVRSLAAKGPATLSASVGSLMSREVTVCHLSDTTADLMAVMTNERVRHLPVVDNDRLVGLISIGDVVKARVTELERDRDELLEYVAAR